VGEAERPNGELHLQLEGAGLELHGRRLFWDVDLRIETGAPVLVTGPSGSGKTLLCMVVAGLLPLTTGEVRFGSQSLTGPSAPRVSVVLQHHGLVSGLTAFENVTLPLQERRMIPSEVTERAMRALGRTGLADEADRTVDELSGGEQQRVGIARAIAGDAAILIADEPTSELDPENRERVLGLLLEESRRTATVLVVASDDPEVANHFERVFVLEDGALARVTREHP
jgi:ABC-type lipoprotein export system ATPase subunit